MIPFSFSWDTAWNFAFSNRGGLGGNDFIISREPFEGNIPYTGNPNSRITRLHLLFKVMGK